MSPEKWLEEKISRRFRASVGVAVEAYHRKTCVPVPRGPGLHDEVRVLLPSSWDSRAS
jgi:hypothetical protein